MDEKIGMNPSRTIRSPRPQITRIRKGGFDIFHSTIGTPDIAYRGLPWHGEVKSESENLDGNNFFKNAERKNNFEVEKLGAKIL